MLELINIAKQFTSKNSTVSALSNINLKINKGEIFGIIGQSGAGKSTLVRCMNLLEKPTSGNVLFDGVDITKLNQKELRVYRRKIGMIFQSFNLLEQKNVLQNTSFPLEVTGVKKSQARQEATRMLELVGLGDKLKAYPSQLSGGQKQRVAIARALVNNPKVILCDEATSALDPTTRSSILDLLSDLNRNFDITIVIITHEMSVAKELCDRVAVLKDGEISVVGSTNEILLNSNFETIKRGA